MIFEIHGERSANDTKIFYYDNETNTLKSEDGVTFEFPEGSIHDIQKTPYKSFDKNTPLKKSKQIQLLKIQMGLSCNYSCDYCSQKFVERAPETSKKDIDAFMEMLNNLDFQEEKGLKVEFWGGEPLVYWKTMKPLAEAIREKFEHWKHKPQFSMITNGSILTPDICDWLMMMDFSVSISHDGPGQSVRGPDPFDDPGKKKVILDFYRAMTRLGKGISFNPMMNSKNKSRKAIYEWFVNMTGDPDVKLGEGGIVDSYDEDGMANSLQTKAEHFEYRQTAFADIFTTGGQIGFIGQLGKIDEFTKAVLSHSNSKYLGQKCGMDDEHVIAVDMRGNVMTCQNVSSLETGKNGESHLGGNLNDYEKVEIKTSTHWSKREECPKCPVLHLCKGACMFLDKKFWDISCANSYSDNVALFAIAIARMTGYIPTLIKHDELPLDRQDIFGTIFEHKELPKKKIIPIKVVSEVIGEIEGVEVYGKSRLADDINTEINN
jgi:uncharacterized protein